jgi:hypothetical protein
MKTSKFFQTLTGYDPNKPPRLKALMMFTFFSIIFLTLFFLIRILVDDGNILSAFWNALFILILYVYFIILRYTKKIEPYIIVYAIVATAAIDVSLIVENWPNTHQLSVYGIVLTGVMILSTKKLLKPLMIMMLINFAFLMVMSISKIDYSVGTKEFSTELYFILIYVYSIIALNFLISYFLNLIHKRLKDNYKENLEIVKQNRTLKENNNILLEINNSLSKNPTELKDLTFRSNNPSLEHSQTEIVLNSILNSINSLKTIKSFSNDENEYFKQLEFLASYLFKINSSFSQNSNAKNDLIDAGKVNKSANIHNDLKLFALTIENILADSAFSFDFKLDEKLKGKKYVFDSHNLIKVLFGFVSSAIECYTSGRLIVEVKLNSANKLQNVLFIKSTFNNLKFKQDIEETFSEIKRVNNLFSDKFEIYNELLTISKFDNRLSLEYPALDLDLKINIQQASDNSLVFLDNIDFKYNKRVLLFEHNLFNRQNLVKQLYKHLKVKLDVFNSFNELVDFFEFNKISGFYLIASIPFVGKSKINYFNELKRVKEEFEDCNIAVILDNYSNKDIQYLNENGIEDIFIRPIEEDEMIDFLLK